LHIKSNYHTIIVVRPRPLGCGIVTLL